MFNLNFCNCDDANANKRNHHGVVCTRCNPSNIETLLIPNEINAYRTWGFDIEIGLTPLGRPKIQGWNEFNSTPPPHTTINNHYKYMKPWNLPASCLYNNHSAPNPYCSCGYYSVKNFGVNGRHYSPFSHDSTRKIIDRFSRNVMYPIERLYTEQQKAFARLFFYSPALKTLELNNFPILSEVALSGNIIECEKGYRSQKIRAKKLFLLVNFFELNQISEQLGAYLEKDNAEIIHTTIVWLDFLNNYLKSISKLYGCSFEMLVNIDKQNSLDFGRKRMELINEISYNSPPGIEISEYLSFEKNLYVNERLRGISDTVLISNKLLKKQSISDLDEIRKIISSSSLESIRRASKKDITFERLVSQRRSPYIYNVEDNFRMYQEKIFAFLSLYKCITKNHTRLTPSSNDSDLFGLNHQLFLKNYKRIFGFEPQTWFPVLFAFLENSIDINNNFDEAFES
tara:strand:+ start:322 stop:1689 length:1368 start_codon:yes stop_codon:yes gene_type:complete